MATRTYTFSYKRNGKTITETHSLSDEFVAGIGVGVFIYNIENHLDGDAKTIEVTEDIDGLRSPFDLDNIQDYHVDDGVISDNTNFLEQTDPDYLEEIGFHDKYSNLDADFAQGSDPDYLDQLGYRYILRYYDNYDNFDTPDFIQGINTAFIWLNSPELARFTREIYDTQERTRIVVN